MLGLGIEPRVFASRARHCTGQCSRKAVSGDEICPGGYCSICGMWILCQWFCIVFLTLTVGPELDRIGRRGFLRGTSLQGRRLGRGVGGLLDCFWALVAGKVMCLDLGLSKQEPTGGVDFSMNFHRLPVVTVTTVACLSTQNPISSDGGNQGVGSYRYRLHGHVQSMAIVGFVAWRAPVICFRLSLEGSVDLCIHHCDFETVSKELSRHRKGSRSLSVTLTDSHCVTE